ncbi:30S ribosomal protein S20 [Candidatus Amesbacteria bacterium]|nr:30S ribosomal protein S20 [Candidatus Amesbacteria bacterium]MBI2587374.1 30S ribosomal protein S20 [Candidatus Amesbacteria bacterium]
MPATAGAIRKLRADKRKAAVNSKIKAVYKTAVNRIRRRPTDKNLREVFSKLDRAVKAGVIAKNKAARLKSRSARRVK